MSNGETALESIIEVIAIALLGLVAIPLFQVLAGLLPESGPLAGLSTLFQFLPLIFGLLVAFAILGGVFRIALALEA